MQIRSLRPRSYRSYRVKETPKDATANLRLKKLRHYDQLRSSGCTEKVALAVLEISRATLYRWRSHYHAHGITGLVPVSKAPKRSRQPQWSKQVEQQVLHLRRQFPLWGKKTLHTILKRDHGITISESTIGRILKRLIARNKIHPVCFYYGQIKPKKQRVFNRHAKRWKKQMKARQAGELLQIDHMSVSVGAGFSVKHFEATCPVTKVTVSQAYLTASSRTAAQFLSYVRAQLPFEIRSIQVDGGSEFRKDFEDACQSLAIPLYVIPPRTPELNGCVERCNRTLRYEFYQLYDGLFELDSLRESLANYMQLYNSYRPHQSLKQCTPLAYYQKQCWLTSLSHML